MTGSHSSGISCESLLGHNGVELVWANLAVRICVGSLNHLQQLGICQIKIQLLPTQIAISGWVTNRSSFLQAPWPRA